MSAGSIAQRWAAVRADVAAACMKADRDPAGVTIVAVAKTHPSSSVREAIEAGALDIGENYAQELVAKRAELAAELGAEAERIRWHFIGRLQRNKAKLVAGQVELVHAVDGTELAEELAKRRPASAIARQSPQRVLLSVNVAGETTKGGVALDQAPTIARAISTIQGVTLDGFMTMPPPSPDDDPEASRPAFTALVQLRDRLRDDLGLPFPVLSMGMSGDFGVAIACGATHVRIGTAIFGARPPA